MSLILAGHASSMQRLGSAKGNLICCQDRVYPAQLCKEIVVRKDITAHPSANEAGIEVQYLGIYVGIKSPGWPVKRSWAEKRRVVCEGGALQSCT